PAQNVHPNKNLGTNPQFSRPRRQVGGDPLELVDPNWAQLQAGYGYRPNLGLLGDKRGAVGLGRQRQSPNHLYVEYRLASAGVNDGGEVSQAANRALHYDHVPTNQIERNNNARGETICRESREPVRDKKDQGNHEYGTKPLHHASNCCDPSGPEAHKSRG